MRRPIEPAPQMTKPCPVKGCKTRIPLNLYMCGPHRWALPEIYRLRINSAQMAGRKDLEEKAIAAAIKAAEKIK